MSYRCAGDEEMREFELVGTQADNEGESQKRGYAPRDSSQPFAITIVNGLLRGVAALIVISAARVLRGRC
jgi:hypothetical protein